MDRRIKDFSLLLKHADIQSLLDIKAFFGEFSMKVLQDLNDASEHVFVVKNGTPIAAFFLVPTDKDFNLFSIMTPKAYSNVEEIKKVISEKFPSIRVCAAIYTGNKKLYNILKSSGFNEFEKKILGYEQRPFLLLDRG